MYCPECGASNEEQATVCQSCGQALPGLPPAPPPAAALVFCPFCGAQNPAAAETCVACKAALPRLESLSLASDPTRPGQFLPPDAAPLPFAPQPEPPRSWWQRLTPDLRAALVSGVIVTGLQVLSDVLPGLGFVFSSPFAVVSYYLQGVLTGKLLKEDPSRRQAALGEYAWRGALSGVWTSVVFSTVLTLLLLLISVPLSAGTFLLAIPIILVNSLVDIVLNVGFSALGAWLYGRLGGRRMAAASAGVMGCGVVLACLLSLLTLAVLGALGISLWQGLAAGYGQ